MGSGFSWSDPSTWFTNGGTGSTTDPSSSLLASTATTPTYNAADGSSAASVAAASPGSDWLSSWNNILQYGIARYIDTQTGGNAVAANQPGTLYQMGSNGQMSVVGLPANNGVTTSVSNGTLLVGAAVVLGLFMMLKR